MRDACGAPQLQTLLGRRQIALPSIVRRWRSGSTKHHAPEQALTLFLFSIAVPYTYSSWRKCGKGRLFVHIPQIAVIVVAFDDILFISQTKFWINFEQDDAIDSAHLESGIRKLQ